jgi:hypothetical protein
MARKSRIARAKKSVEKDPSFRSLKPSYYPVQLSYQLGAISDGPYVAAPWFHSVPRGMSEVNHRLYRTGNCVTMKIDIDNDAAVDGNKIDVYALVNTWYTANAFAVGRAAYETAMAEERAKLGKNARWHDFRPDNGFASQIAGAFLSTGPGAFLEKNDGEHLVSIITDNAGNNKTFSWATSSGTNVYSLTEEYDAMGNVDRNPEVPVTGGYAEIDSDTNAANVARLQTDGDLPPYNRANLTSNFLVKVATLELAGAGSKRLSTGFFKAPCGYVWLDGVGASFPNGKITVTVKAGDYKGAHFESMAE